MAKCFAVPTLMLLVLALAPGSADAGPGGLNLGWGDCQGLPATQNETFSCNTNSGTHVLVGSFVAPCCLTPDAAESVIDLQSEGATLPPWWSLRATAPLGCRTTSLLHSADFTSGPFACTDYWQGAASGAASEDPVTTGNRARIKLLEGLAGGDPLIRPVPEGTEIYVFKCIINNQKTTGLEVCGGCDVGVCLVLNTIMINQPAPNDIPYTTPAQRKLGDVAGRDWRRLLRCDPGEEHHVGDDQGPVPVRARDGARRQQPGRAGGWPGRHLGGQPCARE